MAGFIQIKCNNLVKKDLCLWGIERDWEWGESVIYFNSQDLSLHI